MPNPVTRRKKLMSRHMRHSPLYARRRSAKARETLPPRAMSARRAWIIAMRAREVIHTRIVHAFRRSIAGLGTGPTDLDLQLFARLAVHEQRLKRGFGKARVQRPCAGGPTSMNPRSIPSRGERP